MTLHRPRAATPAPLQIPDLTLPTSDTSTLRRLMIRDTKRWTAALRTYPIARLRGPVRANFAEAAGAWLALAGREAGRAGAIVRLPTIAVLLELTLKEGSEASDEAIAARASELAGLLAVELAAVGALGDRALRLVRPDAGWPVLRSISARLEIRPQAAVDAIVCRDGHLDFEAGGIAASLQLGAPDAGTVPAVISRPYHEIVPGILLATTDNNPLSDFEAHPDKQGNALDLGGRSVEQWVETLRQSFALVQDYLPLVAEEMRLLLRLIVPVGYDDEKHLSASYQEYVGAIYMTLHPNLMTMTEALVHEFQHNKINAAFHHDAMLENAFWPLVQSPVRPDPRPLHGVVLAVHAFQPIAWLYRAMAEAGHPMSEQRDWQRRAGVILGKIHDGAVTVLGQGEPTAVGRQLFREMQTLDDALMQDGEARGWRVAEAVLASGGDEP